MFNVGQSPASIFSPICIQICTGNLQLIYSNCVNHELYSEPTFPAPQLYLLRHTLRPLPLVHMIYTPGPLKYGQCRFEKSGTDHTGSLACSGINESCIVITMLQMHALLSLQKEILGSG